MTLIVLWNEAFQLFGDHRCPSHIFSSQFSTLEPQIMRVAMVLKVGLIQPPYPQMFAEYQVLSKIIWTLRTMKSLPTRSSQAVTDKETEALKVKDCFAVTKPISVKTAEWKLQLKFRSFHLSTSPSSKTARHPKNNVCLGNTLFNVFAEAYPSNYALFKLILNL